MENLVAVLIIIGIPSAIGYYIGSKKGYKKAGILKAEKDDLDKIKIEKEKVENARFTLSNTNNELVAINDELKKSIDILKNEEKDIFELKENFQEVSKELIEKEYKLSDLNETIASKSAQLDQTMQKIDLYSRIDDFVEYGHFETPKYLYEVSQSFLEALKIIRNKQKQIISDKNAIVYSQDNIIANFTTLNKQILNNSAKLMMRTFNIECDYLIEKTTPSNFSKTLERITKLASELEKLSPTLEIVFSDSYVDLKLQECELVYQYKLKKQEEKEEQILLKEQMNEERKANAEYQKAIDDAKKEEEIYEKLLNKVKMELEYATSEERELKEKQIAELQAKLKEAEENSQRAISLAQQTRRGYIYVISNIGSFGKDVYKIGMTRRLEPMDRINELGDASVPFKFDVHAIIYCEDAPNIEYQLHKYFTNSRLNAVNFRKEFFKISLDDIKKALDEIIKTDYEFKTTILAEEYYESLRLQKR